MLIASNHTRWRGDLENLDERLASTKNPRVQKLRKKPQWVTLFNFTRDVQDLMIEEMTEEMCVCVMASSPCSPSLPAGRIGNGITCTNYRKNTHAGEQQRVADN